MMPCRDRQKVRNSMTDIELVIKLPEEYYKAIMKIPVNQSTADMLIIKNGTPISKEYERLTQIKTCKNTMCVINIMGVCGCNEVSLDESGSCIDCIIDDIFIEGAGDTDDNTRVD